jgi:hypothetical protein
LADNVDITQGAGTPIAADEVGGIKHQRVKIQVGADGSASDVQPPDGDGKAATTALAAGVMITTASGALNRWVDADAGSDGNTGDGVGVVHPKLWNGGTFDRERGNIEGTLLASAARTTSTSAGQTNYNARGVTVFLNITAASGTGGLKVRVLSVDPVSSAIVLHFEATTGITATGIYGYEMYPGATTAGTAGPSLINQRTSGVLPRIWLASVNVSDASSYTYSLGYSLIL